MTEPLQRVDAGAYGNLEGFYHCGFTLKGEYIYKSPFIDDKYSFSDDAIGMAGMLTGMAEYLTSGKECYSLKDALQDAYLMLMMDKSASSRQEVATSTQIWAK